MVTLGYCDSQGVVIYSLKMPNLVDAMESSQHGRLYHITKGLRSETWVPIPMPSLTDCATLGKVFSLVLNFLPCKSAHLVGVFLG